jgi:hypothetical protein
VLDRSPTVAEARCPALRAHPGRLAERAQHGTQSSRSVTARGKKRRFRLAHLWRIQCALFRSSQAIIEVHVALDPARASTNQVQGDLPFK